jgi:two-component system NtrC family sensor kinase
MSRLSGFTPAELIEKDFWAFYPTSVGNTIRERGQARLEGEHAVGRYETLLLTKSGDERWVELVVSHEEIQGKRTIVCNFIDVTERKRAEAAQKQAQQLLTQIIDADPVPTLVINARHTVTHWNRACEQVIGLKASELIGTCNQWSAFYPEKRPIMADLIVSGQIEDMLRLYGGKKLRRSPTIEGAYEAEDFFPNMGEKGRWLYATAAPLRNDAGEVIGAIETLQDITERKSRRNGTRCACRPTSKPPWPSAPSELQPRQGQPGGGHRAGKWPRPNCSSATPNSPNSTVRLQETHQQLMSSPKRLASIGQLAAGVAHEINNPIGYVNSNIRSLKGYMAQLLDVARAPTKSAKPSSATRRPRGHRRAAKERADFAYLRDDIGQLISESEEGTGRVRKIVQDLRDFSRTDSSREDWQAADHSRRPRQHPQHRQQRNQIQGRCAARIRRTCPPSNACPRNSTRCS